MAITDLAMAITDLAMVMAIADFVCSYLLIRSPLEESDLFLKLLVHTIPVRLKILEIPFF